MTREVRQHRHFINNRQEPASGGESIEVVDPSTGSSLGSLARGTPADIDRAVSAARAAYDKTWSTTAAVARGRILYQWSRIVADHAEELALLECLDTGKPMRQARSDASALARYFEFYAGAADKLHGQTIPYQDGYTVLTIREPHGVTGHIVPWNYPMQIFGRSVGAAIATGNACVVKPAEDACLSLLRVAELGAEAGLPEGVLNIVTGLGTRPVPRSPPTRESITSPSPGPPQPEPWSPRRPPHITARSRWNWAASRRNWSSRTRTWMQRYPSSSTRSSRTGGRPVPPAAVCWWRRASLTRSPGGFRSASPHWWRDRARRPGPGAADIGPASTSAWPAFWRRPWEPGVTVAAEGSIAGDAPAKGFYQKPMLLSGLPPDHKLVREEVFGPVLVVQPFQDEAEALRLANGTAYGLVAGIWTRDGGRQLRLARKVQSGQVFINNYGAGGGVELPFGGVKHSGYGREKGFEALYGFTTLKTVAIHHG
jgi:aldehyde dehydrogenase (NAD+)